MRGGDLLVNPAEQVQVVHLGSLEFAKDEIVSQLGLEFLELAFFSHFDGLAGGFLVTESLQEAIEIAQKALSITVILETTNSSLQALGGFVLSQKTADVRSGVEDFLSCGHRNSPECGVYGSEVDRIQAVS